MRINYFAPFNLQTGYGTAARAYAKALINAGCEVKLAVSNNKPDPVPEDLVPYLGAWDNPTHQIVQAPPHTLGHLFPLGDAKRIAVTTWETWSLPDEFCDILESYDRVIVPSAITKQQMAELGDKVAVVPHVSHSLVPPPPCHAERPFTFLWMGDWSERKNPIGMLRTYWSFFSQDDNVLLKMKLNRFEKRIIEFVFRQTNRSLDELPPIELKTDFLDDLGSLYASADVFVTLSRGDAWNYPAFDAAMLGLPIIASLGVGHEEFLTGLSGSDFVNSQPTPCYSETFTFADQNNISVWEPRGVNSTQHWMDPDLTEAGYLMRNFYERRNEIAGRYPDRTCVLYDRFNSARVAEMFLEEIGK